MGYYYSAALAYGYECPEPADGDHEDWIGAVDLVDGEVPYAYLGPDDRTLVVGLEGFLFNFGVPGVRNITIPPIPEDYKERLDAELRRVGIEPPEAEPQWWFGGSAG